MEIDFFSNEPIEEVNQRINTHKKMIELLSGISFLNGFTTRQYKTIEKLFNEKNLENIEYKRYEGTKFSSSSIEFYLKDSPDTKVTFSNSYLGGAFDIDLKKEIEDNHLEALNKIIKWYKANKETIDKNRELISQVVGTHNDLVNSYETFYREYNQSGSIPRIINTIRLR